jgi:23S rRNA (cytidine1920-2'-O)/16S rRNA (cytidine1409-2'-O)-methyltransferase
MKKRLDQLVFDLALTESRERAKSSIMSGLVFVNGSRCDKPGTQIDVSANIELRGAALKYVSRGGLKLEKAVTGFGVDPSGKICLDCGASTGGFTDVLLQNGAKKVYAADVGYGQLAWSIRQNPRVVTLERTNARYLSREQIPEAIDLAVMDLSFISIKLVLPAVKPLLTDVGEVVCLIKPQFEAGRESVGKKGVVRDSAVKLGGLRSLLSFFSEQGFTPAGLDYSPIRGPEGNIEYLCHIKNGVYRLPSLSPETVVASGEAAF